ncbi:response regulator [Moritella viscosa]|uniref:Chemotaxis protein CheY (2 CheY domains) n=1 Tax=Moritella viscosa TaxID=80854 RepID=A0A090IBV5_9GAMM|nr:response regulator [Moritella viscosa]CED59620.1 response regulator [Moritella viscosa]SGY89060.1 Chemotaxis protein CheY (2 CheY domains) [Moritella viscosa]SGY89061.1 Chemotaxis protein CheY (2 CheY domains) [Moritella viscosa]SGY91187.1 Chemotaxis protein CheY (2 CheY domains) [Moritella viscosa]SGY91612.1 Chemotaxis protein CheY (2 CheY domains) [Moritella viscosa]
MSLEVRDLSILLIEPSSTQRKFITTQLHDAGVDNIECLVSIEQAKESLTGFIPDLIISAMYFEDGSGAELAEYVKSNVLTENIAFMLISSEQRFSVLDQVKQAGAIAILPKPFKFVDLQRALNATLSYIEPEEMELDLYDVTSLKILVVDDSLTARKHICRVLNSMGIVNITTAENGVEALEYLAQNTFDLIVTDYNMPEMDGKELIEKIRMNPELSYLPVLMVTSEEGSAQLTAVKQAGVSALCDKPFDIDTVRMLVQQLLNEQ